MQKTRKMLEGGKPKFKKEVLVVVAVIVEADTSELYDEALSTVLGEISDAGAEQMEEDNSYACAEAKIMNLEDVQAAFAAVTAPT